MKSLFRKIERYVLFTSCFTFPEAKDQRASVLRASHAEYISFALFATIRLCSRSNTTRRTIRPTFEVWGALVSGQKLLYFGVVGSAKNARLANIITQSAIRGIFKVCGSANFT